MNDVAGLSEAMIRLLKPSMKQKANAMECARIAIKVLDSMVQGLKQKRLNAGAQVFLL